MQTAQSPRSNGTHPVTFTFSSDLPDCNVILYYLSRSLSRSSHFRNAVLFLIADTVAELINMVIWGSFGTCSCSMP